MEEEEKNKENPNVVLESSSITDNKQTKPVTLATILESVNKVFTGKHSRRNIFLTLLLFLIVLALIVILNGPSKEARQANASKLSSEAQDAYNKGDYKTVENKLKEALDNIPDDPRGQAALIKAIANQGNVTGTESDAFARAKPYIDKALSSNPNDKEVLLAVGYAYETAGKYNDALGYYQHALSLAPNDPQALFHKAHVLEFLNRKDEAYSLYTQAYSLDSQSPDVAMAYAKVVLSGGDKTKAVETYVDVSQLPDASASQKAEALTDAAIIERVDLFDIKSSLNYSQRAVEIDSKFSPALAEHGFNLAMNNQIDAGIKYMKQAIDANPRISQNYWRLGGLYRIKGDFKTALDYETQALNAVESDNTILSEGNRKTTKAAIEYDLATTNLRLGNNDKVLPLLQMAVADNPVLKTKLKSDLEGKAFESLNKDSDINKLTL